jgi:hypothetical protein
MITRHWGFPRLYTCTTTQGGGMTAQTIGPCGRWTRGALLTFGPPPVALPNPPGGASPMPGYGYAMDPSDPKTWRRPVRWT